jgi:hypothetical protein
MAGEGKAAMQAGPATSKPGDLPESNQQTSAENRKMHDRYSISFAVPPIKLLRRTRKDVV